MTYLVRTYNYGKKTNPKSKAPEQPENQHVQRAAKERLLKALKDDPPTDD